MSLTTEAKGRVLSEVAAFFASKPPSFADCEADGEVVDFARLKMAGNTKQAKQCKKGYSCGFSCIAKHLNCRKVLTGQAKTYADWLSGQVKPNGSEKTVGKTIASATWLTKAKDSDEVATIESKAELVTDSPQQFSGESFYRISAKNDKKLVNGKMTLNWKFVQNVRIKDFESVIPNMPESFIAKYNS